MQYINWVCAVTLPLMICACSSNQSSELAQDRSYIPDFNSVHVPTDGRLLNEHVRMYVSVKIKQEQFRYENKQQISNKTRTVINQHGYSADSLEKAALEHFEFNPRVYFWAKNTIEDILINYTDVNANPRRTMSNISNPVIAHNLAVIQKFKEDLRFAKQYRIEPKLLTTSNSTVIRKPSS